jgi:hypothetical protein
MGSWWKRGAQGATDVVAALERLMMPRRPDGACWRCHSPNGYFRNRGTATPVWCDRCHVEITAAETSSGRCGPRGVSTARLLKATVHY